MAKAKVPTDSKPTNEELDAKAEQALKEIEAMTDEEKNEQVDEPEEEAQEEPEEESEADPETDDEGEGEDEGEEAPKVKKQSELTPEELKAKLSASSREALVLHAQNKRVNEAIQQASSMPDPTEDELKAYYTDWEDLDDFSKKMARDNFRNNKRLEMMTSVNQEFQDSEAWNKKVDAYIDDPATITNITELDGLQEEFKAFSAKPTRRLLDMEDLTKIFLYELEGIKKSKPKPKGSQFAVGNAGPKGQPKKTGKISIEEGARLRKTNYNEYMKHVKAGNIETGF